MKALLIDTYVCSKMKKALHLSPVMIEGSGRQDLNIYFTTLKE